MPRQQQLRDEDLTDIITRKVAYFNKPSILYVEEEAEVKLIIVEKEIDNDGMDTKFANLSGEIVVNNIRVGAYVGALISAPGMNITANGERIQKANCEEILFSWFVTPKQVGEIPFRIDVFSQDSPAKDARANVIRVLQEGMVIDARGLHWTQYELSEFNSVGKSSRWFCEL